MIFKVINWTNSDGNHHYVICCEKPKGNTYFIWKDGTVNHNSTGYLEVNFDFDHAAGYWSTQKEAEIFLAGWKALNTLPKPDLSQVDYEPEYELGTRYVQYINGIRTVYRYVKLDFGVTAEDSNQKTYNYI